MTATMLREKVRTELTARRMSWNALQKAANVGQRTITDIKNANPRRSFGLATLVKFDEALGLPEGTLYKIWEDQPRPAGDDLAAQVEALEAKVSALVERPWMVEEIKVLSALSPEDRAMVLDLARRLGRS